LVEDGDVVDATGRGNDDGGKVAPQGKEAVQFDGNLPAAAAWISTPKEAKE
jgi:hypothetical protein